MSHELPNGWKLHLPPTTAENEPAATTPDEAPLDNAMRAMTDALRQLTRLQQLHATLIRQAQADGRMECPAAR